MVCAIRSTSAAEGLTAAALFSVFKLLCAVLMAVLVLFKKGHAVLVLLKAKGNFEVPLTPPN